MITVSIPCNCGAEIHPLDRSCPGCGTPVSGEQRDALEASLEASHSEYREARQQVRGAATMLLVAGLMHLAFGLIAFYASGSSELMVLTPEESRMRVLGLAGDVLVAGALLGCHQASKRRPLTAFTAALVIWLVVRLVTFTLSPGEVFLLFLSLLGIAVLMSRLVLFVVLVRGIVAARRLQAIAAGVARGALRDRNET